VNTLGELVKEWREKSGLNTTQLARLVSDNARTAEGRKVKRQHIEQLEAAGKRTPRYIADLARAMETTVDNLLALRMPPAKPPLFAYDDPLLDPTLEPDQATPREPNSPTPAPSRGTNAPPPKPDFTAREFTETDWSTLQAVKLFIPEEQLADYRRRAAEFAKKVKTTVLEEIAGDATYKHAKRKPPAPQVLDRSGTPSKVKGKKP